MNFLSPNHEVWAYFIGLKWIEMVEILVGEVDRRSPKDGSRAQLTQVNRDKACHKYFDLEAS